MHRDNPDLGIKISAPYYQTLDGDALIVLSRRINHADGCFAGVVTGAMRIKYVEQLFRGITIDSGSWITLLMTDGTIIARSPHRDGDAGRNISRHRSSSISSVRELDNSKPQACRGLRRGSMSISRSAICRCS